MFQYFKISVAAAAPSAAMEAVNHSKNSAMEAKNHEKHLANSMKTRFFSCIAMIAFFVAIFMSCGKDDNNKVYLPVEIVDFSEYYGEEFLRKIEYDSKKRITKISAFFNGELDYIWTFGYNSAGDLISLTETYPDYPEYTGVYTFSRNGNDITVKWPDGTNAPEFFTLNSDETVAKITWEFDDEPGGFQTVEYKNGNAVKTVWHDGDVETITYGEMKSPFYHCKTPKWIFWYDDLFEVCINNIAFALVGKNNPLTYTRSYSSSYTFTYHSSNEDGFPTSMTVNEKWYDEEDGDYEFEYTTTYKYEKK